MLSIDASGVFPIAPTPFLPDGRIDRASTDRMIDHYVAAGADGVTILGNMAKRRSWITRKRSPSRPVALRERQDCLSLSACQRLASLR
jgi:hypothetical protein